MRQHLFFLIIVFLLALVPLISAHGGETHEVTTETAAHAIQTGGLELTLIYAASGILALLVIISFFSGEKLSERMKHLFFVIIVLAVGIATFYLVASTLHLNFTSETGGPVHWHADYEVWLCEDRAVLKSPEGFSNKVGNAVLHGHEDDRMHVEGVLRRKSDANLGSFFEVIGGSLSAEQIQYPTDTEMLSYANGDACPAGTGTLRVYVNGRAIENAATYVMAPEANVPPGDCIIIEFGTDPGETTERLCTSWVAQGQTYEATGSN